MSNLNKNCRFVTLNLLPNIYCNMQVVFLHTVERLMLIFLYVFNVVELKLKRDGVSPEFLLTLRVSIKSPCLNTELTMYSLCLQPVTLLQRRHSATQTAVSDFHSTKCLLKPFGFVSFFLVYLYLPSFPCIYPSLYLCLSISLVYNPHCFQTRESV